MSIDKDTVKRVAKLARIRVTPDELGPLATEISGILGWIEQLNEVNTDGVQPMARVVQMKLPMREDVVTEQDQNEKVLKNAPDGVGRFFTVPKVVE
ncbi:Asp-tRNA(Asn)/Glu-tRNA(Gln) amidotransferase subunit GatC [Lacibacterium aquatile]|uniref:Aspartyl/glutamyl-tRNA(Asn/Gln) amidotransferase subunit C n=1 Tax=Lacibacterium aquatile TaxID=1168082 RepID=A0ABW5DWX2_9PROT